MCNCKTGRIGRKKTYMARSKTSGKIGEILTSGAGVAAGIVVGKMLTKNIGFLDKNPIFGAGAQLVLAGVVFGMRGKMTQDVAAGMAANGVVSLLNATAGDLTAKLGISGIGSQPYAIDAPSVVTPGVAGYVRKGNTIMTN